MNGHDEYLRTIGEIRKTLVAVQKHRAERRELVDGQPAWLRYEQDRACHKINRLRARLGKGPIPLGLVVRAESRAAGHADYTAKFALVCADLVHDHFVAGS